MISMNINPPRLIAARKLAITPAVKARILKSCSVNMGSRTCSSTKQKATSSRMPTAMAPSTNGFVQPMAWPP